MRVELPETDPPRIRPEDCRSNHIRGRLDRQQAWILKQILVHLDRSNARLVGSNKRITTANHAVLWLLETIEWPPERSDNAVEVIAPIPDDLDITLAQPRSDSSYGGRRMIDVRLDRELAETLKDLRVFCDWANVRMRSGRHVTYQIDVVRWLLDVIWADEESRR